MSLIKRDKDFTCPIGKEVLQTNHLSLDSFPPNYPLRDLIEKSLEYEFCQIHKKELQYVCIQDQVKVCNECGLFGEHRSHDIKPLSDLKSEIEKKIKELQGILQSTEKYGKNIENIYQDKRKSMLDIIKSKFRDLQFVLNAKEGEFLSKINSFYDNELETLHLQIGEGSMIKQIISAKASEYRQLTKCSNPFKLLQQDFSNILQDTALLDKTEKIEKFLQQVELEIESMLSKQLSDLEKMTVAMENQNLMQEELDLKLDEQLSSFTKLEKSQSSAKILSDTIQKSITTQGSQLSVSYPFDAHIQKNLNFIHSIQSDKISALRFQLSKDLQTIPKEDILKLCYIRSNFPRIQDVEIFIENHTVSDEALLEVFWCIFWKNDSLRKIDLDYNMNGNLSKSILFIAENVLPEAKNLKRFGLYFSMAGIHSKACHALSQNLSMMNQNLTYLQLLLNCQEENASSLQKLFVCMPNLKFFGIQTNPELFNDEVLQALILNTLPSLKSLEDFQIILSHSSVTDLSVKRLFDSFPQEWLSTLKVLRVNLSNTKVTDKSLQVFVSESLPKFKNLNTLLINTNNTFVTSALRDKLSQWKPNQASQVNK